MTTSDLNHATKPLTTFGRLELYTESMSNELNSSQYTSVSVAPDNYSPLRCRKCGNANEFEIETSICLTQHGTAEGGPSITIASNRVYVRDISVTLCKACDHIGPYHEFVDQATGHSVPSK